MSFKPEKKQVTPTFTRRDYENLLDGAIVEYEQSTQISKGWITASKNGVLVDGRFNMTDPTHVSEMVSVLRRAWLHSKVLEDQEKPLTEEEIKIRLNEEEATMTKLDVKDVRLIRAVFDRLDEEGNLTRKDIQEILSKSLGVTRRHLQRVATGERWSEVE